jgi:hypothetical protein
VAAKLTRMPRVLRTIENKVRHFNSPTL